MKKTANTEQHWLSLDGICTTLRLDKSCVLALAKRGDIVVIWGPTNQGKIPKARFLDPTPQYAEQLRMAEMIHSKRYPIPPDISEYALLTAREVALVMGWTLKQARMRLFRYKVPPMKAGSNIYLYSAASVRDMMWRVNRSTVAERSPFLLSEMIEFFQRWYADEVKGVPTDDQFAADDEIQRRLAKLIQRAEKDQSVAKADFASKIELARKIVEILQSAKTTSVPDPSTSPRRPEAESQPQK